MLLIFFIPFISLIENVKIYLTINTFSVLFRFFSFLKYDHENNLFIQRIVDFVIGLVWLFHHSIFMALFFYQDKDLSEKEEIFILYLGISAIITVTTIIILQTIKFIILVITFVRNCYIFFSK